MKKEKIDNIIYWKIIKPWREQRICGNESDTIDEKYYEEYVKSYEQDRERQRKQDRIEQEARRKQELLEKRNKILNKKFGEILNQEEIEELSDIEREYFQQVRKDLPHGDCLLYQLDIENGTLKLMLSGDDAYEKVCNMMRENVRNVRRNWLYDRRI